MEQTDFDDKVLLTNESINGYKIIVIFIIAFFVERFYWILIGIFTTSIRKLLNLPSLFDEILRIINFSILGLFQLVFWIFVINKTFNCSFYSISFSSIQTSLKPALAGFLLTSTFLIVLFVFELYFNVLSIDLVIFDNISFLDFILILVRSFTITFWVALMEELVFRGFVLYSLCNAWGNKIGVILMTIFFSLPHFLLKDASKYWVQYAILLIICSLLFAFCYLKTSSIALSFGIHLAFNFISQDFLNLSTDSSTSLFGFVTSLNFTNGNVVAFFMEYNFLGLYLSLGCVFLIFFLFFQTITTTNYLTNLDQ